MRAHTLTHPPTDAQRSNGHDFNGGKKWPIHAHQLTNVNGHAGNRRMYEYGSECEKEREKERKKARVKALREWVSMHGRQRERMLTVNIFIKFSSLMTSVATINK